MNRIKVLHITSHLGGGIGRVLSGQAVYAKAEDRSVDPSFICLEAPVDRRFIDRIEQSGCSVLVDPDLEQIKTAIEAAAIVQLDWWHHPLMAKWLGAFGQMPARWVVWSHVSGLSYPKIPDGFVALPEAFIATTTATLPLVKNKGSDTLIDCVNSVGGFDGFPEPDAGRSGSTRACYLGSLNFAKLHPAIMDYVDAVDDPAFSVDLWGDRSVNPGLEEAIKARGDACKIRLRGFCERPQDVLPVYGLFVYLLNPDHYGTTENALLEAMACGLVPIVLNNPVEKRIVKDKETGLVVKNPQDFAEAVRLLAENPVLRERMGIAGAHAVRQTYGVEQTARKWEGIYQSVLERTKKRADFSSAFGTSPSALFLSCLGDYKPLFAAGAEETGRAARLALPFLYEKSKSSVFHFCRCFPEDRRLADWAAVLYNDKEKEFSSF